jgi:hypothetical protein
VKYFLFGVGVAAVVLSAAGCGAFSRHTASITGFSRQCIGGVSYLQFPSGVTVEYQPNGTIKGC